MKNREGNGWRFLAVDGLEQRKNGPSSAYAIAQLYATLEDRDRAFQWLNTAFQEHNDGLEALKTDPSFDALRSDPRFAELVRKVGLPQ